MSDDKSIRVELRDPDDTVVARGTYKPVTVMPRLFHGPMMALDRWYTIDETSIAPGEPIIYRLGRVGEFVEDAA